MEKRVLLAAGLSMLAVMAWMTFVSPPPTAPPVTPGEDAAPSDTAPRRAGDPTKDRATPGREAFDSTDPDATVDAAAPQWEPLTAATEQPISIQTDLAEIELTNRGAGIRSWKLREYTTDDQTPLALFPSFAEASAPLPLFVDLEDRQLADTINQALFDVERVPVARDGEQGPGETIRFRWADTTGLSVVKSLTIREGSYLVDLTLDVTDRGRRLPARLTLGPGFAAQNPGRKRSSYYYDSQCILNQSGQISRLKSKKLTDPGGVGGGLRWAGFEDQYFTAVLLPQGPDSQVRWSSVELARTDTGQEQAAEPKSEPLLSVTVSAEGGKLYVGPKKYTLLRGEGYELEKAVWFSSNNFLSWISRGIFLGLLWIHDHTLRNYGVAIILSTFLLRLLLFPINQYSMVSMKKAQMQMSRLQPKVKAIKAKYKKAKDAESRGKMNQEMMAMYKTEGVNPMGGVTGCIPLVAQFPILIAFYNMLTVAIELRGAPFFGWIQDLARPDPFWIMPLLMGVTMFAQQKLAMTKVKDPQQMQQQKIMMFMPVVFTVICVSLPSGMVLYWFVNNLLGIGQQYLVNRHTSRLEAAAQKA